MANGRRYYPKKYVNRDKYSVETTNWITAINPDAQSKITIVAPTNIEGMRKCKHFELTFSANAVDDVIYYALVFVPQGYGPNSIVIPSLTQTSSLYEPNQFVISSGCLDFTGGPLRIRTPLSRNLNSGDQVVLVLAPVSGTAGSSVYGSVKYAITLQ